MRRIHIKMANTNNATTTIELKHVQAQKIRQKITRGKKLLYIFSSLDAIFLSFMIVKVKFVDFC